MASKHQRETLLLVLLTAYDFQYFRSPLCSQMVPLIGDLSTLLASIADLIPSMNSRKGQEPANRRPKSPFTFSLVTSSILGFADLIYLIERCSSRSSGDSLALHLIVRTYAPNRDFVNQFFRIEYWPLALEVGFETETSSHLVLFGNLRMTNASEDAAIKAALRSCRGSDCSR